jgi:branched-chain amino acid transport system permease protein
MFWSALANGLALGAIYALIGSGLNLIFGVVKVINFAQGALVMMGVYAVYWFVQITGLDPYLSFPIVIIILGLFGYFVQRIIINRVLGGERTSQLLITFGIGMFIESSALALWGPDHRSVISFVTDDILVFGDARIRVMSVVAIVGAALAVGALLWFLDHSRVGTAIRAVAQQPDSAELSGIDVKRMFAYAFAIGSAVTGFAAVLIAPIYDIHPLSGEIFGIMAFIVVVLGGLGNVGGAAVAGVVLGLGQILFATFVSPQMAVAFIFLLFLIILFVRPTGIFGKALRVS